MTRTEETMLFEVSKMPYRIWGEILENSNVHVIDVGEEEDVTIESCFFKRGIVSRIQIYSIAPSKIGDKPSIFMKLFMGNIEICTHMFNGDVMCQIHKIDDDRIDKYYFRQAESYDYKNKK